MTKLSAYYLLEHQHNCIQSLRAACNKFLSKYFEDKIFVAGQKNLEISENILPQKI